MTVFIDVTRLLDRGLQARIPTGVDRVSLEYVRHFRDRAEAVVRFGGRWVTLGSSDSRRLFDGLVSPTARIARFVRWNVAKAYVGHWCMPAGGRILLNTGHSGLHGEDYAVRARQLGMSPVFFLHDLIPITHPEYCRAGEGEKHKRRLRTMLSAGRALIVNSEATREELTQYARRIGHPLPPCVVAPLAPGRLPAPQDRRPLDPPYYVMLGTIEPRKNHLLLLHLWRQLVMELGDRAPRLVLIGQRGWECEQVVDLLERCEVLRGIVLEKGRCGDQALATWLHHAQALLFPSFAEGFGMPLVEALSFGVPVIASDLRTFREVAGEVPEYLDPLDGPAWKDAILAYANGYNPRRRKQMERLAGYRASTWNEHFAFVERLLGDINERGYGR